MQLVEEFFQEIDQLWPGSESTKVRLRIIGCGALMLQANYERGTKDSDVFETTDLSGQAKQQLIGLAGPGTDLHRRRSMYIDIVANGIPFLSHAQNWLAVSALNARLQHLELYVLDVVDVVVSKLKRMDANCAGRTQSPGRGAHVPNGGSHRLEACSWPCKRQWLWF